MCHTGNAGCHFQYCQWAGNGVRQVQVKMSQILPSIIVAFFLVQYSFGCCKLLTVFHSSVRVGYDSFWLLLSMFLWWDGSLKFYTLSFCWCLDFTFWCEEHYAQCRMKGNNSFYLGDYLLQIFLRLLINIPKLPSKNLQFHKWCMSLIFLHTFTNTILFLYLLFGQGKKVSHFNFNPHYKCFSEIKHVFTY